MSQSISNLLMGGSGTPEADRAHRLLVAQRLAEAVEEVHASGGVIGNLDGHRVLVTPDGTVTFSDVTKAGPEANATTAVYTPPELQGSPVGQARPESQHDAFALAVLLFQLLMNGNHPYAGQWVGGGNLPDIPKAIQLGLYAYGNSAVTPPPGAPALSALEPGLADLFKRSFAATSAIFRNRPSGAEWARALAAVRDTGQGSSAPMAPGSPAPEQVHGPVPEESQVPVKPAGKAERVISHPGPIPEPAPQSPGASIVYTEPLPEPQAEPLPRHSAPAPIAEAVPPESAQVQPETDPRTPVPQPSNTRQDTWLPEPGVAPVVALQPAAGVATSPRKRKFSRRAMLERVVPPTSPTDDSPAPDQPDQSQGSVWGDLAAEFRWLANPDQYPSSAADQTHPTALRQPRPAAPHEPGQSDWGNLVSEIRWFVESDLHWLTDPEFWRRFGKFIVLGLIFLIWLVFGRGDNDPSNRDARPAVVRATRVPATQTPRPRATATQTLRPTATQPPNPQPTTTRIATTTLTGAGFANHFNVSDGLRPSTGERFSANIRDNALRMEVFGRGSHGKAMFNAAPVTGDFQFIERVEAITGQGEILIYFHEPEAPRTWAFTVDPVASTWGLSLELPQSATLIPVIAPKTYRSSLAGQPLRSVGVNRKDGQISVVINSATVSRDVAENLPDFSGPVTVGVGAMIPDDPALYNGQSFVVTVDYVVMRVEEG